MATNSALATAGNEPVDAPALLDLVIPSAEPAPAPTKDVASKQQPAPKPVRIGSEDLTPEQITARFQTLQSQVDSLKPLAAIGQSLQDIKDQYGVEAAQSIVEYAQEIEKHGGVPKKDAGESWLVSPIDVPSDSPSPTPFKWADADEFIQYLYAHTEARAEQLNERYEDLLRMHKALAAQFGHVANATAEHQLVADLQKVGVPATLETVQKMRAMGVEPRTAMQTPGMLAWMRSAHQIKQTEKPAAPVEAPASQGENVFDLDDPKLTVPEKIRLLSEGATPTAKDPKDVESFRKIAERHGVKLAS